MNGFSKPRKAVPSKFIYDEEGSYLFEAIPTLDEYYQTRTEISLLKAHAAEISALAGPRSYLVDYGSGSGEKSRILLDALETPGAYVPLDISTEHLADAAEAIAADYPGLAVHAVAADFLGDFQLPDVLGTDRRLGFFPGATIGNFTLDEAAQFLRQSRSMLSGGYLLIGVDLKKDVAILEAAYNDSRGVSSAFNLNLLSRINRELGGDIQISKFRHSAVYDAEQGRVNIGIQSLARQAITIEGQAFELHEGEIVHTQHAYKFTPDEFSALAAQAGFQIKHVWTDTHELYALFFLEGSAKISP
ncbi:MAG: L-histidine N(alpha)-methyltransferase [Rhodospirillaceae bacterium]|nr:L-histidine N(alpha)-methyltransferase [Rhodospirillaceae bacterium]